MYLEAVTDTDLLAELDRIAFSRRRALPRVDCAVTATCPGWRLEADVKVQPDRFDDPGTSPVGTRNIARAEPRCGIRQPI